ncbi:peptidyl-tRNA hydrolase ICT1, mitochondrial [Diorhabda sublineata]|uniref:peptidyl-tRNA hydrolase ICT1, mitochondrial n=1 Tax=Diorhabda sublineata TaxID=1163346 RepID=UPI0024E178E7|nr:peptidyl-tRNA hydrolase ICT1, mitochondrial [Diorhabda sublineata]
MNVFKRTSIEFVKCLNQTTKSYTNRPIVTYNSAISLKNLYPNSSLKITTPKIPDQNTNGFTGFIPMEELQITFSRSSGPGGQNVNKVNTKVDIRFHLKSAKWLNEEEKQKMFETFGQRLTQDGYLIFRSDLTRSQQLNVADCLEKIRKAVRSAVEVKQEPSPESQERARRRLERASKERLLLKRQRSQIKQDRRDTIEM